MNATICCGVMGLFFSGFSDPAGDVFLPGAPSEAASSNAPDLVRLDAALDHTERELRLTFEFLEPVFPADDFDHIDRQLHGFVDIDLDVPPTRNRDSRKSLFSGFDSQLGIEAYLDLTLVAAGQVDLLGPHESLIAQVPIQFADSSVTIRVPFDALYGNRPVGESVAIAAFFFDFFQETSDVFPNADGFVVVPEPTSCALVGLGFLMVAFTSRHRYRLSRRSHGR